MRQQQLDSDVKLCRSSPVQALSQTTGKIKTVVHKNFPVHKGCVKKTLLLERENKNRNRTEASIRKKERLHEKHLFVAEVLQYEIHFQIQIDCIQGFSCQVFMCIHMYYRYPCAYVCICILICIFSHGPVLVKHPIKNKKMACKECIV